MAVVGPGSGQRWDAGAILQQDGGPGLGHDGGVKDDAPSFERIVSEHGPLISRIARSYEADPALCEDLIQQIFLAIWQSLPNFRGESTLRTFVARIAQNRSISHVARRTREPATAELPVEVAAAQPTPEDEANEAAERNLLLNATRRLPPPQREVIILVLEGFSYPEISEMLGIAQNALALRLSRAKSALKSMLERTQ